MAQIIDLEAARQKRVSAGWSTMPARVNGLNQILWKMKTAIEVKNNLVKKSYLITYKNIYTLFLGSIMEGILNDLQVNYDLFDCGKYIARILTKSVLEKPANLDILECLKTYERTKNPCFLIIGGNICFLNCSLLPMSNIRPIGIYDCQHAGKCFYLGYYQVTFDPVGWHMANWFEELAGITQEYAFKKLFKMEAF